MRRNYSKSIWESLYFLLKRQLLPVQTITQLYLHHDRLLTHCRVRHCHYLGHCALGSGGQTRAGHWLDGDFEVLHDCGLETQLVDVGVGLVVEAGSHSGVAFSLLAALHPDLDVRGLVGLELEVVGVLSWNSGGLLVEELGGLADNWSCGSGCAGS
jgi:hypothetical protein